MLKLGADVPEVSNVVVGYGIQSQMRGSSNSGTNSSTNSLGTDFAGFPCLVQANCLML